VAVSLFRGKAMKHLALCMLVVASMLSADRPARAQNVPDPLDAFNGRWTWVGHAEKLGKAKACAEHWEEYKVSADRREIRNSYLSDKGGTLTPQPGRGYIVLYRDGNSVAMYLNEESRKYKNGDHWVWVMQMENPDLFYWRILTTTTEQSEGPKYARVRCPAN